MYDQIVETWEINHRVNLMLLKSISEAGLRSTLSVRGGRDVARQFAHMHDVRIYHLEAKARDLAKGLKAFATKGAPKISPSKAALVRELTASADAIGRLLARGVEAGGVLKGFKRGVIPALGYFIAHESHHRGSILLTLKQTGHKVDTEIQYGIWDWSRI